MIVAIVIGAYYGAKSMGWLGADSAARSYTYIDTTVSAKNNATNDIDEDITRTWFKCDITDMEIEDIEALTFADFEQMSSTGERIEDVDLSQYIYVLKINGTGFEEKWFCTSPLVAEGKMFILALGPNDFDLYESAAAYSMLAFPTNMPNATTVNLTNYADWTVNLFAIDGNGEATNKVGFECYYDFGNAVEYLTVITLDFNTTVVTSDVVISTPYTYTKIMSGTDKIQFLIDCDYTTGVSFTFELADELGTDWELNSIAIGYGYEGSVTTAITQ